MPKAKSLPSREYLLSRLCYDPETGALTHRPQADKPREWNARWAGKAAGTVRKDGAITVNLDYDFFLAHRVIWKMLYGTEPPEFIDHKDGDPGNNRQPNLREATVTQNNQNTAARKGRDLPKGVRRTPSGGRFLARIVLNGKQVHLGCFDTPELAHDAYMAAATLHFGEFARAA